MHIPLQPTTTAQQRLGALNNNMAVGFTCGNNLYTNLMKLRTKMEAQPEFMSRNKIKFQNAFTQMSYGLLAINRIAEQLRSDLSIARQVPEDKNTLSLHDAVVEELSHEVKKVLATFASARKIIQELNEKISSK